MTYSKFIKRLNERYYPFACEVGIDDYHYEWDLIQSKTWWNKDYKE